MMIKPNVVVSSDKWWMLVKTGDCGVGLFTIYVCLGVIGELKKGDKLISYKMFCSIHLKGIQHDNTFSFAFFVICGESC